MPSFLLARYSLLPDGGRKVFPLGEGERFSFHSHCLSREEWFSGMVKACPSLLVKMEEEERKRRRGWEEVETLSDPFAEEAVRCVLFPTSQDSEACSETCIVRLAGFASKLMGVTDGFLHSLLYHVRCFSEGKRVVFTFDGDWLNEQSFTWAVHFLLSSLPDSLLLIVRRPTSPSHLNFLHSANPPFSGPPLFPNEEGKPMSWADGMRKGNYANRVFLCFGKAEEGKPTGYANLLVADLNVYMGGGEESRKEMSLYEEEATKKEGVKVSSLFPEEKQERQEKDKEWEGFSLVSPSSTSKSDLSATSSSLEVRGFLTKWFEARNDSDNSDKDAVIAILKKAKYDA